jgi:hypothetical protein
MSPLIQSLSDTFTGFSPIDTAPIIPALPEAISKKVIGLKLFVGASLYLNIAKYRFKISNCRSPLNFYFPSNCRLVPAAPSVHGGSRPFCKRK